MSPVATFLQFTTIVSFWLNWYKLPLKMKEGKKHSHEMKRTKTRASSVAGFRSVNIDIVKKNVDSEISKLLTLLELFFCIIVY